MQEPPIFFQNQTKPIKNGFMIDSQILSKTSNSASIVKIDAMRKLKCWQ